MSRKSGIWALLSCILFPCQTLTCLAADTLTTSFAAPARSTALGGAYAGLAEGLDYLWFNPAGGADISQPQWSTGFTTGPEVLNSESLSAAFPIGRMGSQSVLAGEVRYLNMPFISGLTDNPERYIELNGRLAYGRPFDLIVPMRAGIGVHLIQGEAFRTERFQLGLDLGFWYQTMDERISCGLSIQNWPLLHHDQSDLVPIDADIWRVGGAFKVDEHVQSVLDVAITPGDQISGKSGIELISPLWPNWTLATRLGYSVTNEFNQAGFNGAWSGGLGLSWKNVKFDYGFKSQQHGLNHTISLSVPLTPPANDDQAIMKAFREGKESFYKGMWLQARAYFEDVLELNPHHQKAKQYLDYIVKNIAAGREPEVFFRRGFDYYKKGDYNKAIAEFKQVLQILPEHRSAALFIDVINEEKKIMHRKLIAKRHEKNRLIRKTYKRAVKFYEAGNYKEALIVFDALKDLDPGHPHLKDYREKTARKLRQQIQQLAKDNDWRKALVLLKLLIKEGPRDKAIHTLTKTIVEKAHLQALDNYMKEQKSEALEIWTLLLDIDPGNRVVRKAWERAHKERKDQPAQ